MNTERGDNSYDLIAIGSGPAGESATELAAAFGRRCLVIERNKPGGTVTTTGGVPTKTLREAALYFTGFRDRDVYGVRLQTPPELALDAIRQRTWGVCETLQRATYDGFIRRGIDYLQGNARLGPDRMVVVALPDGSERILRAKVILIATGSRPVRPANVPTAHPGVCDTDTILSRGGPAEEPSHRRRGAGGDRVRDDCAGFGYPRNPRRSGDPPSFRDGYRSGIPLHPAYFQVGH